VVRPGIERWNRARLNRATSPDGALLTELVFFFRQILDTTTVNLTSSSQPSSEINDDATLTLPSTFFLNTDSLLDDIGLEPQIAPISVSGRLYRESLRRYQFALTDGLFRQEGDSFFAFLVPEPAFEDLNVLTVLLQEKIITLRFAACLLMVDFPNPISSSRRRRLLPYLPATARLLSTGAGGPRGDLEAQFVAALEAAEPGSAPDGPEREFLAHWRLPETDWKRTFEQRIEAYFVHLRQQAVTESGFDGWVRLAESRRREFRRKPLAEFRLTLRPPTSRRMLRP